MANNTTSSFDGGDLFIGTAYMLWLENYVLPYIFGILCIVVVLLGLTFNIAYAKLFVANTSGLMYNVAVALLVNDMVAYVIVLAPSTYMSLARLDDVPDGLCVFNAICTDAVFNMQMAVLLYGLVLSVYDHVKKTVFERTKCSVAIAMGVMATVSIAFAVIPVGTKYGYRYFGGEYQCSVDRYGLKPFVNVWFVVFYFIPCIVAGICVVLVVRNIVSKRQAISDEDNSSDTGTVEIIDETTSSNKQMFSSRMTEGQQGHSVSSSALKPGYSQYTNYTSSAYSNLRTTSLADDHQGQTGSCSALKPGNSQYTTYTSSACSNFRTTSPTGDHVLNNQYHSSSEQSNVRYNSPVNGQDMDERLSKKGDSLVNNEAKGTDSTCGSPLPNQEYNSVDEDKRGETTARVETDQTGAPVTIVVPTGHGNEDTDAIASTSVVTETLTAANADAQDTAVSPSTHNDASANLNSTVTNVNKRYSTDGNLKLPPFPPLRRTSSPALVPIYRCRTRQVSVKKPAKQPLLSETIFNSLSDDANENNRQMAQCLVTWSSVAACWLPYVVMVYIDVYRDTWWTGWLTVAMMCANMSYCIKPILLLGTKKQLMKSTEVVLPKKLNERAGKFKSAVTKVSNVVGNRLFASYERKNEANSK